MTVGVYFEKFLFVLAGVVWGLYLLGASTWIIASAGGVVLAAAGFERLSVRRRRVRLPR